MPATTTTGSVNIASLDSKIVSDLCAGIFYTDITPSVYIGGGASNILGASLKVTNPYGVVIKNYPTSGYDIYAPLTSIISLSVPTQAGNYQYGTYTFDVLLTDADGTTHLVTKPVDIKVPDSANKTRNYGSLSAKLDGVCKDGKVYIIVDTVPTYKGAISTSQVNDFSLEYPTSSGLAKLEDLTIGTFSTTLFEGVYKFEGTICALYNLGDNVFAKINYKVKRHKNIRCLLDETCIDAQLSQLQLQLTSECTDAEKQATQDKIVETMLLVKLIELKASNGFDPSDYIDSLEDLLGCVCTCNCAEGTPVINTSPARDYSITGCNVEKTTVGLTDTYVIDNHEYVVEVTPNGGIVTISTPVLGSGDLACRKTQTLTFYINTIYSQIKNQIVNTTEYNYWASIINKAWDALDASCISATWAGLTYAERSQLIFNAICGGGDCEALISTNATNTSGADVVATWANVSDVYEVSVYVDSILIGTVLNPTATFTMTGKADGTLHTYKLISKCSNGSIGNLLEGSFTYYGCPTIAPPTVSDASISDATCPYDLTALVAALPSGISSEWHSLNNTLASSLVADPSAASAGTYYVFAKDTNGCYSLGVSVVLACSSATSCTAPQLLIVEAITGDYRVRFASAAYPPPSNSYTVKRRLYGDPDVDGSYTTIGTPTWNATVNRWEILDTTGVDNTLYVYKAISNCSSTTPSISYTFANITCPTLTLTPAETTMGYSFTGVGGSVDKYEVKIYNSAGTTLIHTDTILPAFSTPITGTFIYLTQSTIYKVKIVAYIGTYYTECAFVNGTTTAAAPNVTWDYDNNVGVGGQFRISVNGANVVTETTSNNGTLLLDIGDVVDMILETTLTGTAVLATTGPYTNTETDTHVVIDSFTVAAGSYVITADSNA